MEQIRIVGFERDVASKSSKKRRGRFHVLGGLPGNGIVLDDVESVAEAGKGGVPRGKLRDFAKGAPRRDPHCMVVTALTGRRKQLGRRPLQQIGREPFRQALDIGRGRVETVGEDVEQCQDRSHAVYDQADGTGPIVVDIRESLGVDVRPFQCRLDVLECGRLFAGERSQYESEAQEKVLTVEYVLSRGYEALIGQPHVAPYGQDITGKPLCRRLTVGDYVVTVYQLDGDGLARDDVGTT